jgi:hypothetical protein
MTTIEAAFWGDENSTKNVTNVLKDKIEGNKVVVNSVDDKLIPAFTVAPKGELTGKDVEEIRSKAEQACGGPGADQNCIKLRTSDFTQQALQEKAEGDIANTPVLKGKRLTVRLRDQNGKMIERVVPENGKLEIDGLAPTGPKEGIFSMKFLTENLLTFLGVFIGMFVWVFSVVATYTLFSRNGWGRWAAIGLAVVAMIVPGSGFFLIAYFFGWTFVNKYVELSSQK